MLSCFSRFATRELLSRPDCSRRHVPNKNLKQIEHVDVCRQKRHERQPAAIATPSTELVKAGPLLRFTLIQTMADERSGLNGEREAQLQPVSQLRMPRFRRRLQQRRLKSGPACCRGFAGER